MTGKISAFPQTPAALAQRAAAFARHSASFIDDISPFAYAAAAIAFVLVSLFAAWFMAIEPDESWILISAFKAMHLAPPGTEQIDVPTLTSGGLYVALHGLLGVVTMSVLIHRLVSTLFFGILLALCFRYAIRNGANRKTAAIVAAGILSTAGLVLQTSLAMAEIIVVPLLIWAAIYWHRAGHRTNRGSVLTGILLGLCCATRTNCIVYVPVFAAFALFGANSWREGLARAAALVLGAGATYAALLLLYIGLFGIGSGWKTVSSFRWATGGHVNPFALNRLSELYLAGDFFALPLIGVISVCLASAGARNDPRTRLPALLACMGLIGAAAWVFRVPIPHVRYAWPSAVLLVLSAGLALQVSGYLDRLANRMAVHAVLAATITVQLAASLLYIGAGDSLLSVYQIQRTIPLSAPFAGRSMAQDQRALADAIRTLPASADIATNLEPLAYPLTYLSGRRIRGAVVPGQTAVLPNFFVVTPGDGYLRADPRVRGWLDRNARPVFRSGQYELYAVAGAEPYPA